MRLEFWAVVYGILRILVIRVTVKAIGVENVSFCIAQKPNTSTIVPIKIQQYKVIWKY